MSEIRYTEEHEAVLVEGDVVSIGISDYAVEALGDLVFIELPEVGKKLSKGDEFAVVESIKIASEIYTPVAGEIVEVNSALADNVEQLQESVDGEGWIVKVKVANADDLDDLMNEKQYRDYVRGLD